MVEAKKITDWFAVITEINRLGITHRDIADQIGIPKTTIIDWKQGAEPRHADGEVLIDFWCRVTGKDRFDIPTVSPADWHAYHSARIR